MVTNRDQKLGNMYCSSAQTSCPNIVFHVLFITHRLPWAYLVDKAAAIEGRRGAPVPAPKNVWENNVNRLARPTPRKRI
jgi:hypothetical protein